MAHVIDHRELGTHDLRHRHVVGIIGAVYAYEHPDLFRPTPDHSVLQLADPFEGSQGLLAKVSSA